MCIYYVMDIVPCKKIEQYFQDRSSKMVFPQFPGFQGIFGIFSGLIFSIWQIHPL